MIKVSIPDRPSIHDIRSRITALKRIDLRMAKIDVLKSRLKLLFRGFVFSSPVLMPGQVLYRGISWSEKPQFRTQLSYPPCEAIKTLQRVNRQHKPMFYCSASREAPIFELGLKPGNYLAISKWLVNQRILVSNIGYSDEVFRKLGSARQASPWWQFDLPQTRLTANSLIANFMASEFARVVNPGEEHLYKLPIAIAEKLYLDTLHPDPVDSKIDGMNQIGGIVYPSISMRANSDNVALVPEFVDRFVSLEAVEWIRIDKELHDFKFQVTNLDFANSFSSDGQIEWKGRRANWFIGPGRQVCVSVEHGKYIVRDEQGNIIEPA